MGLVVLAANPAAAHGAAAPGQPWVEGIKALFGDPASLLVLLVLAMLMAQPGQPDRAWAWRGGLAGALSGSLVAASGRLVDPTLTLYAGALLIGVLVAWARPWPKALHAVLAGAVAGGVVLMLMPAEVPSQGFRVGWIAGVLVAIVVLFANLIGLLLALLGRRPGPVKRLLLRVAGSWAGAAALLAGVLEMSQRAA